MNWKSLLSPGQKVLDNAAKRDEENRAKKEHKAQLQAFERTFPGVQNELKELRSAIEADPKNPSLLLVRARYYDNSRLPSAKLNCEDDCTRAIEIAPTCAEAYQLRAQCRDQKRADLSGKWPARAALDYLSAFVLDPTDVASRSRFLQLTIALWKGKFEEERQLEIAALEELLVARLSQKLPDELRDALNSP